MKKAKISELKNRLSYYLRFVRRGQSVLVYDRDRAIARIDPVRDAAAADSDLWTAELERLGVLRAPTSALTRGWLEQRPRATADVVAVLIKERESGR
jgi:antitoxin (DNA-binding transcriptional repressor) of toxin-antitoxin stability system